MNYRLTVYSIGKWKDNTKPCRQNVDPIAELVQMACKYDSHIEIEGEGKNINAKSLMGIMAFGLKEGIEVKVIADGSDENEAADAIRNFLTCSE